jgi:ABC-type antimicrobial peptide transport system permease subunit
MENTPNAKGITTRAATPDLLSQALADEIPEVEYAASVSSSSSLGNFILSTNNKKTKATGQFASKDFFNIFSYDLVQGDPNIVLSGNNSVVISEQLALKIFNTTENVVGKSIDWELADYKKPAVISGIFKGIPSNSTEQFDFILSRDAWIDLAKFHHANIDWDNHNPSTYVVLKKSTDARKFNDKIAGFIKTKNQNSNVTLFIRQYSDGYLYNKYENGNLIGGRIEYVRLFSLIAFLILMIACINFMNLSTAKASGRMKEVGIKKTIGASRKSLVIQYLAESILITLLSLIIALLTVMLILPQFNDITGKHLTLILNTNLILFTLGITLLTGLAAGSYPALYLSGFNPALILKGKLKSSISELFVRKGLVVFQFTMAVMLIIAVMVVNSQMEFIQTKNPGYNKDNVIYFKVEGQTAQHPDAFLSEVRNIPGIVNASGMNQNIIGIHSYTYGLNWAGKNPGSSISFINASVDFDMIETLDIQMKEGRSFSRNFGSDSSAIIFNQAAIDVIGLKNPLGKSVNLWGKNRQIIGVIKDFNFESLHEQVKPLFFKIESEHPTTIMARIKAGMEKNTIDRLQNFYTQYNPGFTFEYNFLDRDYQELYVSEQRITSLSKYFAGMAIIISCLGLFGLSAFSIGQRTKEIGLRKILGASVPNITALISKQFILLVLISNLIAWPAAYYFMNKWLQDFAYRIDISWWVFVLSGGLTSIIAMLTIGYQAIKAATANPVEALRYE